MSARKSSRYSSAICSTEKEAFAFAKEAAPIAGMRCALPRKIADTFSPRGGVAGARDVAVSFVVDHFAHRPEIGNQERLGARHRLERGHAEGLASQRGQAKNRRPPELAE